MQRDTHGPLAGSGLRSDIGGAATNQYGRMTVGGTATLGGNVIVALSNSFTPTLGARFDLMSFGSRVANSEFENHTLPSLGGGRIWDRLYDTNRFSIQVV